MKGAACNAKRSDGLACRHKQENAMFLVMMVPPPLTARRSPLISSKAFLTPTRLFLGSLFSRRIFVDAGEGAKCSLPALQRAGRDCHSSGVFRP